MCGESLLADLEGVGGESLLTDLEVGEESLLTDLEVVGLVDLDGGESLLAELEMVCLVFATLGLGMYSLAAK